MVQFILKFEFIVNLKIVTSQFFQVQVSISKNLRKSQRFNIYRFYI